MQSLAPFVSALVIAAYLAAVCLDCEPPATAYGLQQTLTASSEGHHGHSMEMPAADSRAARDSGHAPVHEASVHEASHERGHRRVHHRTEQAIDSNGHGQAHGHDDSAHANAHAGDHAGEAPPARAPTRARSAFEDLRAEGLTFVATCLCGCSETRSTVGGNASRLGSVVPGVCIDWQAEADALRHVFPASGGLVGITLDLDPIPI